MKRMGLLALLLVCSAVQAQGVLLGKKLIGKGDETAAVRDAAGAPDKLDRIDGDASTPTMEIWTYRRDSREITLWVVSGKVVKVEEHVQAPPAAGSSTSGIAAG